MVYRGDILRALKSNAEQSYRYRSGQSHRRGRREIAQTAIARTFRSARFVQHLALCTASGIYFGSKHIFNQKLNIIPALVPGVQLFLSRAVKPL